MALQSYEFNVAKVGISHEVIFAGDNVSLAGQIDYPNKPVPTNGYPLLFILPNACCTGRHGFEHHAQIGLQAGFAVFRWDKRGTGHSGSGGKGNAERDAIAAYSTAIRQADIDPNTIVIWSQTDASLLLGKHYEQFKQHQQPKSIILTGNMLDENAVLNIDTQILCITGERDWNFASRYAINTTITHNDTYNLDAQSYIARFANRKLIDTRNNLFHSGAEATIQDWLYDICHNSTLI
jgi:hypothetical protein